jgi:hypothetical protein
MRSYFDYPWTRSRTGRRLLLLFGSLFPVLAICEIIVGAFLTRYAVWEAALGIAVWAVGLGVFLFFAQWMRFVPWQAQLITKDLGAGLRPVVRFRDDREIALDDIRKRFWAPRFEQLLIPDPEGVSTSVIVRVAREHERALCRILDSERDQDAAKNLAKGGRREAAWWQSTLTHEERRVKHKYGLMLGLTTVGFSVLAAYIQMHEGAALGSVFQYAGQAWIFAGIGLGLSCSEQLFQWYLWRPEGENWRTQ